MARILLIDDDVNLLQMVKLMLTRVGHEVETSDGGEKGIALAAQNQPDLAIIDVMMPGLSGYDVVGRLRDDPDTARIPIIILTARSQPMDKRMALDAGANAFLSKPVTAQELTERVDAVLQAGVDYRVHTGLLTEPITGPSAQPEKAPEAAPSPDVPPALKPLGRLPIGAEDVAQSAPTVTAGDQALTAPKTSGRLPIGAEDVAQAAGAAGPAPPFPIVAVVGLRGGTGSTTVAVNLAALLMGHGRRVCLADLSATSGHVPLHLRTTLVQHWGQLVDLGDSLDPKAINQLLVQHNPSGIALLGAPPVPTTQTLSTHATQSLLRELGGAFSYVVVDVPNLNPATVAALQVARSIVIVMSDDPASIQTTGHLLTMLQNMGLEPGRVRVALNHVRSTPDVGTEAIQKAIKRPLSVEIPYEPNQITAIRRGVPLVIAEPDGRFAQAIKQLARTLMV